MRAVYIFAVIIAGTLHANGVGGVALPASKAIDDVAQFPSTGATQTDGGRQLRWQTQQSSDKYETAEERGLSKLIPNSKLWLKTKFWKWWEKEKQINRNWRASMS
ncbi:RxLR effector protein [Phytophthora megakarya]|uniref:RxLR effector protein n=1 Tax=Phytophthora megakarya TaxID=4795 RepID=A0A225W7F0_9STRA|nr:RxLR effector protein [Phytophthora megakarya]